MHCPDVLLEVVLSLAGVAADDAAELLRLVAVLVLVREERVAVHVGLVALVADESLFALLRVPRATTCDKKKENSTRPRARRA